MPSRLFTGAILAFWLAMTAVLIQREVMPMMLADDAPTYRPDLTDELAPPKISWTILRDGKRAGSAISRVVDNKDDRTYELYTILHFDRTFVQVKKIESMDRINYEGKLQALTIKFALEMGATGEIRGEVVNQALEPHLFIEGVEQKFVDLGKIDMTQQGNVINPMILVNRLRGLYEGRTWKIPMFDPFRGINLPVAGGLIKQMAAPPSLIAEVKTDTLTWDRREVACYKIEYHEAGKDVTARTWARKNDGLVLQQESAHLGFEMVLQRMP
jgi:hypothetical protein